MDSQTVNKQLEEETRYAFSLVEDIPDEEKIRAFLETAIQQKVVLFGEDIRNKIEIEKIINNVNRSIRIKTDDFSKIDIVGSDHIDWLSNKRDMIEYGTHWNALRKYFGSHLPREVISKMDKSTDLILESIEDPDREGNWSSRGLVIGDIQSGKTSNYLGLISKAVDVGYDAVIVLTGLLENLRLQTQISFENAITGKNTIDKRNIGVGEKLSREKLASLFIPNLTDRKSDIKLSDSRRQTDKKFYAVTKKNTNNLKNLIEKLSNAPKDSSLLLIDDEADNASINTKKSLEESSRINKLIKDLLSLYNKSSYIGYTATPFANVLIDRENTKDLFPRNFILVLSRPDNYIGAADVFGRVEDDNTEEDQIVEPLKRDEGTKYNWFINLDNEHTYDSDWDDFLPEKHPKDYRVENLPESLLDAIASFYLAVTIRNIRGDIKHHKTMLIHVTNFIIVQNRIKELVDTEVDKIYDECHARQFDEKTVSFIERAKKVYEASFHDCDLDWEKIKEKIKDTSNKIKNHVFAINGDHKDVIDEKKYPDGLSSIRIGGNKLSRGLVLPGLSTSYFLRVRTRMYDTLMQMGRWFGYRDGYQDLCKIYTTAKLYNWYGHIANASEDLRQRIQLMNGKALTPEEYQQKIRSHPGMMLVTALNKQYHAKEIALSFGATLQQISGFDVSEKGEQLHKKNIESIQKLVDGKTPNSYANKKNNNIIFSNIKAEEIINFLESFKTHKNPLVVGQWTSRPIINYIKKMSSEEQELTEWTVVLFSKSTTKSTNKNNTIKIGSHNINPINRKTELHIVEKNTLTTQRRALLSDSDERLDLNDEELIKYEELLKSSSDKGKKRLSARLARSPKKALLVIYIIDGKAKDNSGKLRAQPIDASVSQKKLEINYIIPACGISFPDTSKAKTVNYTVSKIDDSYEEEEDEEEENENEDLN